MPSLLIIVIIDRLLLSSFDVRVIWLNMVYSVKVLTVVEACVGSDVFQWLPYLGSTVLCVCVCVCVCLSVSLSWF